MPNTNLNISAAQPFSQNCRYWSSGHRSAAARVEAHKIIEQWGYGNGQPYSTTYEYWSWGTKTGRLSGGQKKLTISEVRANDEMLCDTLDGAFNVSFTELEFATAARLDCDSIQYKCKCKAGIDRDKWAIVHKFFKNCTIGSVSGEYDTCDEEELEGAYDNALDYAEALLAAKAGTGLSTPMLMGAIGLGMVGVIAVLLKVTKK